MIFLISTQPSKGYLSRKRPLTSNLNALIMLQQ